MVGIQTHERGQIEGHGKAGLALLEEVAIAGVGFLGGGEAGELAHGPEAAAIHGFVDAASVRESAGGRRRGGNVLGSVEDLHGESAQSCIHRAFIFARSLRSCSRWAAVCPVEPSGWTVHSDACACFSRITKLTAFRIALVLLGAHWLLPAAAAQTVRLSTSLAPSEVVFTSAISGRFTLLAPPIRK